jgi:hypothetical protein
MRMFWLGQPKTTPLTQEAIASKIDQAVTAIRLEAERRDLGRATILISAERLRQIMRDVLLA